MPYPSFTCRPRLLYHLSKAMGMGAAPPTAMRHWSSPRALSTFLRTRPPMMGRRSSLFIFCGGILACTPCWNLTHRRGTLKKMVGRARCRSAVKVSSDSANHSRMPVFSQPCSTSTRSATWASGR